METIWLDIVKERLRRKCESPLTKYLQKVVSKTGPYLTKNMDDNQNIIQTVPLVYHYKLKSFNYEKGIVSPNTSLKIAPLSTILLNKQDTIVRHTKNSKESDKFSELWPGLSQFEKSYKKYCKGE